MNKLVTILFTVLLFCGTTLAQISESKITAGDGETNNEFGCSVSISGEYSIVGVNKDNDNGPESGSAYIFQFDGAEWIQEAKLLASDGSSDDWFGFSVAISGEYAVVGAPWNDGNGNANDYNGAAYIFHRSGNFWNQEAKLTASDGERDDLFGYAVSISGDYVIVGANSDDDNGNSSGSAYIFKHSVNNWIQEQKLVPSDGEAGDEFGCAVSISDDYVLIGARFDDTDINSSGSAYVYKYSGASWNLSKKLTANDRATGDRFGHSVSIDGNILIIGASQFENLGTGSAYIFRLNSTDWVQQQILTVDDGESGDELGWSVSISGSYACVGARSDDNGKGSVYLFTNSGTNWSNGAKLSASDGEANGQFGFSVSNTNDFILIGAHQNLNDAIKTGSAYIYSDLPVISETQLIADFNSDVLSGSTPLTVHFSDLSLGNPTSWEWDFDGDNIIDSYLQNPEFTYTISGMYTVSLTVSNGDSTKTKIVSNYITVSDRISYLEYYFDVDPGFGNGNSIFVSADEDNSITLNLDISNLNFGVHTVYFRTKDESGKWSFNYPVTFLKEDIDLSAPYNLKKLEYFVDSDPGKGLGENIPINEDTITEKSFIVNLENLDNGYHTLYIRSMDAAGRWSLTHFKPFLNDRLSIEQLPLISKLEYFLDDDPGIGNGHLLSFTPDSLLQLDFTVDLVGIEIGSHELLVRAFDNYGNQSFVYSTHFIKESIPLDTNAIITKLEYYFAIDSGFGAPIEIPITSSDSVNIEFIADISSLKNGLHTIYIRTMDSNGHWSMPYVKPFLKESTVASDKLPNITSVEWFFSRDSIVSPIYSYNKFLPDSMVTQNFKLDLSSLDIDKYYNLHIFGKDENGITGLSHTHNFKVERGKNTPPELQSIPDIIINEDDTTTISLNSYVSDIDNDTAEINFSYEVLSAEVENRSAVSVRKELLKKSIGENGQIDLKDLHIIIDSTNNRAKLFASADSSGQFRVSFTASDPLGASDSDTIKVSVLPENDKPFLSMKIPELQFYEDADDSLVITNLNEYFDDKDNQLEFSVTYTSGIIAAISVDSLYIHPIADYFGTSSIFLTATDGIAFVTDTAMVNVLNVNDAPESFQLFSPVDGDTLSSDTVLFSWFSSKDVDGDTISYQLRLYGETIDTVFTNIYDTLFVFDGNGIFDGNKGYDWFVDASDSVEITSSIDTLSFVSRLVVGLDQLVDFPKRFSLYGNYPNPFNPSTTIRYDLPNEGEVNLSVFNILGQKVITLVNGTIKPGYHSAIWDGTNETGIEVGSGIYIYRIKFEKNIVSKKMLLVK